MEGNILTKESSIGETLLLKPPPSKSRPEMPEGEFENLLRFEASRRKERGDMSSIKMISDGMNG